MKGTQRKRDWRSLRHVIGDFLKNDFGSMLDIVPVPHDTTKPGDKSNAPSKPTSNTSADRRTVRKVESDAKIDGSNSNHNPPGLDHHTTHSETSNSSSPSNGYARRRPSTAKKSSSSTPLGSFTTLFSTQSRSSVSTGTPTLLTPSQSSRDLVSALPPDEDSDEAVNILFTRSEVKPSSAEDLETLARIRAAYPDPNQRSFATASFIQRSDPAPKWSHLHSRPTPLDSPPAILLSGNPCPSTGITDAIRSDPSPDQTEDPSHDDGLLRLTECSADSPSSPLVLQPPFESEQAGYLDIGALHGSVAWYRGNGRA